MKYICILVINIFFVVACDSDGISGGVTDIDISDENCEGKDRAMLMAISTLTSVRYCCRPCQMQIQIL